MNDRPVVIDLFAGAGGLSLGASLAGFRVAAAIELDQHAIATHARNFPTSVHAAIDVASLSGDQLLALAKLVPGQLDGLIGGPPCQGFSSMGRRDIADPRNNLFDHFFRLVSECRPRFFIAENVPGIMDDRYDAIRENAFAKVRQHYEMIGPVLVKANEYGAPTTRTRYFFIGYDRERFGRTLTVNDFKPHASTKHVVVAQALSGLMVDVDPNWQSESESWQRLTPGRRSDYVSTLLARIPKGVGDPHSLERFFKYGEVSGFLGTHHLPHVVSRFDALEPGQADKVSKAIRLSANGFCPTLRAGTGKDKGSFQAIRPIHYLAPRVITPREAARLQGFPDWFTFHPTKWHSFRQIGNSVSPVVAEQVLTALRS
ncbi:DNA cytosine methyltransferase [Burkholderia reimsis]|uniref:Cytosine-specific methyltransferase n=1 Tax=Burkholderia reimsis TaxID=2234132 RepID=A0A365R0D6_9BURK|nr:DNA cytosine methyltransferase [Burkholderia reimsis]RBB41749.1 DNA cytosine methyltransferase [Burkholderia reimsis]